MDLHVRIALQAVDREKSEDSDNPNKKKDATSKSKPPSKSVKKPKKK